MRIRTTLSLVACVAVAAIGCHQAETNNCCPTGGNYVAPSGGPVYSTPGYSDPGATFSPAQNFSSPAPSYSAPAPSYSAPSFSAPAGGSGNTGGFSSGSGGR